MRAGLTPNAVQWCRCGGFRGPNLAESVAVRRRFRAKVGVFWQSLVIVRLAAAESACSRMGFLFQVCCRLFAGSCCECTGRAKSKATNYELRTQARSGRRIHRPEHLVGSRNPNRRERLSRGGPSTNSGYEASKRGRPDPLGLFTTHANREPCVDGMLRASCPELVQLREGERSARHRLSARLGGRAAS